MEKQETLKIIDEIIEKANEIKDLQKRIGVNLIDDTSNILVYEANELLKYAEMLGERVKEEGFISSVGLHYFSFVHRGYEFASFVPEENLEEIREKVLPPTKVTEPNNKE